MSWIFILNYESALDGVRLNYQAKYVGLQSCHLKVILRHVMDWLLCCVGNTHTRLMALCPGLRGWAGTRKVKPIWILLKQETVSGSRISLAKCKSAPRSRQITMPAPHHSVFLQAGCSYCCPTNSFKALKASAVPVKWSEKELSAVFISVWLLTVCIFNFVLTEKLQLLL